ncbi:hypothetical protein H072_1886 [Dactylellina haptotyla CBS 200.50]|uniref:Uncharacterized protein n=1 Tax=Dactylellina haptotyla (strain CBS 200.50) TaxID=1284197 RepID=S8AML8_DACHA|nr:hypothetical protein H072_1886 [Dactylellina haptotyla CBS 200.50]
MGNKASKQSGHLPKTPSTLHLFTNQKEATYISISESPTPNGDKKKKKTTTTKTTKTKHKSSFNLKQKIKKPSPFFKSSTFSNPLSSSRRKKSKHLFSVSTLSSGSSLSDISSSEEEERGEEEATQQALRVGKPKKRVTQKDLLLAHAVHSLRTRFTSAERREIKQFGEKILDTGACGRVARDGKWDAVIKEVLLGCVKPGAWSVDERRWEMKKFAGIVHYALKIIDGEISENRDSVPSYLLRTTDSSAPNLPLTLLSTYTPDGREVRSHVERYLPQIFNTHKWTLLAPLMWCVQPRSSYRLSTYSTSTTYSTRSSKRASGKYEDHLKPKIIIIQVPGGEYLLYRYFPYGNADYEAFVRSVEENMMKSGGGVSAEVRFAIALFERGVEVCMTIAEAGWLVGLDASSEVYGYRIVDVEWKLKGCIDDFINAGSERSEGGDDDDTGLIGDGNNENDDDEGNEPVDVELTSEETKRDILERFARRKAELMNGLSSDMGWKKNDGCAPERRCKIREVKMLGYWNYDMTRGGQD